MKILLTGATGFIGSHICRELLDRGFVVYGTTRRGNTKRLKDILGNKNFNLIKINLSNEKEIYKLPEDVDIIYHTASQQPSEPNISFQDYLSNNVLTMRNLLDYYYENKKLKLFVFSSTTVILNQHNETINEKSEVIYPINDYALTKFWAEILIRNYSHKVNFNCIVLRYPSVYGKSQTGGIIYYYYDCLNNNKNIEVFSKGKPLRNAVHVSDVVKANLLVLDHLDKLAHFELLLIGAKNSLRMIELADIIKKMVGSQSKIKLVNKETFSNRNVIIDISKAKKLLHYAPLTIEEGLELYIKEMGEI